MAGATGFIGRHVFDSLTDLGVGVYGFARNADPSRGVHAGDLTEPKTYGPALEGARAVVHAVSYLGSNPVQSRRVNIDGTRNLLEACARANVERVVYVSTAAVYGFGPHRGLRVEQAVPAPASVRSAHRLEAEKAVLAAGGCVVRPNLVYGRGDRWVVPAIVTLVEAAEGLPHDGEALLSVISAAELGSAIAHLCLVSPAKAAGKVFHATRPEPISVWQIASTAMRTLMRPATRNNFRSTDAWPVACSLGFNEHQYDLLNTDHWYDPGGFWEAIGLSPDVGFEPTEEQLSWYLAILANDNQR